MKTFYILLILIFSVHFSFSQIDTVTTASGLKYIVLEKGSGVKAEQGKEVIVHYTGWLIDGKKFDSSLDRKQPFSFILGASMVIKGWDEGLSLMSEGDKYRFIIPPDLAYGSKGAGKVIPPDAFLIFDVQLLSVINPRLAISDTLYSILQTSGLKKAIEFYEDAKSKPDAQFKMDENELNNLGYQLLFDKKIDDAIEVFKLNIRDYPDSFNVYDSMGEAYMIKGDKENAAANYKRSLQLNPDNTNAQEMLKKLEGK